MRSQHILSSFWVARVACENGTARKVNSVRIFRQDLLNLALTPLVLRAVLALGATVRLGQQLFNPDNGDELSRGDLAASLTTCWARDDLAAGRHGHLVRPWSIDTGASRDLMV